MRHGKKFNHLGRKAAHREAMLSNMASSLIKHKRINTTVAKAKALRKYIEPIITKAKSDTTHSRRVVFSYLQDKESVTELFSTVADKVASRPGGYTRIIRTETRLGDNAELCMMELVDFNELMLTEKPAKKSRRSRRGGKKKDEESTPAVEAQATEEVVEETPVEETKEEAVAEAEVVEEVAEETATEEVAEEEPVAEASEEETPEASAEESTDESSEDASEGEEEKK